MTAVNFSYPFIRRPVGTALLAIGIFLTGAVAYGFLPVSSMPTIEFPTIRISATMESSVRLRTRTVIRPEPTAVNCACNGMRAAPMPGTRMTAAASS